MIVEMASLAMMEYAMNVQKDADFVLENSIQSDTLDSTTMSGLLQLVRYPIDLIISFSRVLVSALIVILHAPLVLLTVQQIELTVRKDTCNMKENEKFEVK